MNFSKRFIINRAMENPDVAKTMEAIFLTNPLTEVREFAVKAFEIEFCKEITELFVRYLSVLESNKYLQLKIEISLKGKETLLNFKGKAWQIENLLLQEDTLVFEISYQGQTLITIKHFDTDKDKSIMFETDIYLSKDQEKNNIIYNIIKSFEEISN